MLNDHAAASSSSWAHSHRWIWSALAVLLFWGVLSAVTNRFSVASLSGIFLSASFLTVAGIGQMFVVTTGRGNIDLSIPSVLTLSAYIALLTVRGQDANLALGVLVALAVGLAVGLFNAALVVRLRVPGNHRDSRDWATFWRRQRCLANRSIHGFAVSPALKFLAAGRVFGTPIMLLICIALIVATEFVLRRTVYGRTLSAVGQNRAAARLAGVAVDRVITIAFVISAMLASVLGLVLGAYVGGAFLEMGQPYLLAVDRRRGRRRHTHLWRLRDSDRRFLRKRLADLAGDAHANHAIAPGLPGYAAGPGRDPCACAGRSRRDPSDNHTGSWRSASVFSATGRFADLMGSSIAAGLKAARPTARTPSRTDTRCGCQLLDPRHAGIAKLSHDVGRAIFEREVLPGLVAAHDDDPPGLHLLRRKHAPEPDRAITAADDDGEPGG